MPLSRNHWKQQPTAMAPVAPVNRPYAAWAEPKAKRALTDRSRYAPRIATPKSERRVFRPVVLVEG